MQRPNFQDDATNHPRVSLRELLFWITACGVTLASLRIPVLGPVLVFVLALFILARLELFLPQKFVILAALLMVVLAIVAGCLWLVVWRPGI